MTTTDPAASELPAYFISHGGGPWPWLEDQRLAYMQLATALRRMPEEIGCLPKAILMVSAHWEEPTFSLTGHAMPPMVFDYFGFPLLPLMVAVGAAGLDPATRVYHQDDFEGGISVSIFIFGAG